MDHLVDALRCWKTPEPQPAEIAEGNIGRHPISKQLGDGMRDEGLAPVGGIHDPCRTVQCGPEKIVAADLGFTAMNPATNHKGDAGGCGRVAKLNLNGDGTHGIQWATKTAYMPSPVDFMTRP